MELSTTRERGQSCLGISELKEEFVTHFKTHILQFAIFLIPLVGMIYKTREVVYSADKIKEVSEEEVKGVIRNFQISDIFFGIASGVETALAIKFSIVSLALLPFLVFSVVVKT